jgi:hypothetical protein
MVGGDSITLRGGSAGRWRSGTGAKNGSFLGLMIDVRMLVNFMSALLVRVNLTGDGFEDSGVTMMGACIPWVAEWERIGRLRSRRVAVGEEVAGWSGSALFGRPLVFTGLIQVSFHHGD